MRPLITLQVTEDDIKNGVRLDRCSCPVALAARRRFPDASHIEVDSSQIRVHYPQAAYGWYSGRCGPLYATVVYTMTGEAGRFVVCFDEGASVVPCELQIQEDSRY